jgi:LuxR family maltose regulon positive regulatory protein
LELRTEGLQFLLEETTDFLNHQMRLDLPQDEVAMLQSQLEGWIAGLQLVALTRQRGLVSAEKLAVSGKHRFIADYLNEDVLAPLTDRMRQFLLQTSILDRLSSPLCDAVTEREGSQELLEMLERENLFLMPMDDSRQWFRYHRLFADVLYEQLRRQYADQVADLHRRASHWYFTHELPEPAFHHALEAHDVELVIQIFERYLFAKIFGGEVRIAMRWLDSLPEEWYSDNLILSIDRAASLVATGALDLGMRRLEEVEQRLKGAESEDSRGQLARVTALRCFIACFQHDLAGAQSYADQALRELPDTDLTYRADIYHALGDTYRHHSRWNEAREYYLNTLDLDYSPVSRLRSVHVFGALADLELRQGRLRESAAYWRKALAVIQERETWGSFPLPLIGWVYIRLSEILYEWNELEEAQDYLSRGLERAELGGDMRAMIAGDLIAGRMKLTKGDHEGAEDDLERARPLVESAQFAHWTSRFERFQLELWLALDKLRAAVDWSDAMLHDAIPEEQPESEVTQLAMAWVLIVKGDSPSVERALTLIENLLHKAETVGRKGVTIEAFALQALAHGRRRETAAAMTSLERALRLAEPEGYIRLFADFGLPMARLLQEARSRAVLQEYVEKLLAAFVDNLGFHTRAALPEPLTRREQEILELVAAGLTNDEIANKLVISPGTVKKHTSGIYGKLSVSSRTEAAIRARELDLLN